MPQLSIEQRTFIVKTFYETGSLQEIRNQFREVSRKTKFGP